MAYISKKDNYSFTLNLDDNLELKYYFLDLVDYQNYKELELYEKVKEMIDIVNYEYSYNTNKEYIYLDTVGNSFYLKIKDDRITIDIQTSLYHQSTIIYNFDYGILSLKADIFIDNKKY